MFRENMGVSAGREDLNFEALRERKAHEHDPLKVRWQSGAITKVVSS
jgi:hypothetical protein